MTTRLDASFAHSLGNAIGESKIVAFNVGPRGDVYLVLALEPLDYRSRGNTSASFPKTVPDSQQRYRVLAIRSGRVELDLIIDKEQFNIHDIQPLENDILLVCARSEYRGPDNFDLNGRVYTRDGTFLKGVLLGDGLSTIQVTQQGEIWAAYFDEGIFGNYGWLDPVGSAGLVAWSRNGEKIYDYEAVHPVSAIDDCTAINVTSNEDVWCYYYSDFPLVHLHRKQIVSSWAVPVNRAGAFAVADGHALFLGINDGRDLLHLVRLGEDGRSTLVDQFELHSAGGEPLHWEHAVGRGGSLYILGNNVLYEIALADVLEKHGG